MHITTATPADFHRMLRAACPFASGAITTRSHAEAERFTCKRLADAAKRCAATPTFTFPG